MSVSQPVPRAPAMQPWVSGTFRPLFSVSAILALLAGAWLISYAAGGSRTAAPHGFYLAIVLAALLLGAPGGALTGLAAGLLSGPLLPLNVATGESQLAANWLLRAFFFVLIGVMLGLLVTAMRRNYEAALEARFDHELRLATESAVPTTSYHQWQVRELLEQQRFTPVFQPIYALDDGRLLAVEALTRFTTEPPEAPDVWFRRADDLGMGRDLEVAVILAAVRVADTEGLPEDVALSLNCSPGTLADPRLLHLVRTSRRPVVFEITEHVLVEDYHELDRAMALLREHGARFAVDDAGAGFASLRHIVRLAPEIIKLDMSLTQNLRHDPIRRKLADCLIRFARETGSELVAEGIEHHADLVTWRDLGAHGAQGYHLARPGPLPVDAHSRIIVAETVVAARGPAGLA
ncbi:EAL domain-containing protein [Egicoccus sp. AB-alg6-2]|uniref:EAL domain-containing protein n=1 Tax=Egicoccus sp. AB-alg6-2 TaxID=3242692 RepID=UPI00359D6C85